METTPGPEIIQAIDLREVADHIENAIHLDLNSVSFSKKDPDLLPEAGPCTTCHKRTGFTPALFPDIKKKDTCTDPQCFNKKVQAFIARWLEEKSHDSDVPPLRLSLDCNYRMKNIPGDRGAPMPSNFWTEIANNKKDSCPSSREGIVVEGHGQGQVMMVCADPKCKKHHPVAEDPHPRSSSLVHLRQEKQKAEEAFRLKVIDAIMAKVTGELFKEDLALIAGQLLDMFMDMFMGDEESICTRHGIEAKKGKYGGKDYETPLMEHIESCETKAQVLAFVMEIALFACRAFSYSAKGDKKDPLLEAAKRYKVNVKAIEKGLAQEMKDKAKKKVQPSAKSKKAKK
jgi:hypothetical protein